MPSNLQLSKVDKMENINSFKELIKTKMIGQVVDDYFWLFDLIIIYALYLCMYMKGNMRYERYEIGGEKYKEEYEEKLIISKQN